MVLFIVCALHVGDATSATAWLHSVGQQLEALSTTTRIPRRVELCQPQSIEPYLLCDRECYLQNIALCKEKIEAGDSYEICLTNRVRVPTQATDNAQLFETYLTLREINPAPYACYLKDEQCSILCSSPERFLKIDRRGQVEARPIKGTMPRDPDPERDAENKDRLRSDKRFFSENLMIVDLLRSDLSRSCVPGTVTVPDIMKVESYATVHQLVSTIRGDLQGSVSQCIARCFPGGSMTGAPKRRTLEIINDIEGEPRGVYSGAIGYLSINGTADLNIVIRTIVIDKDHAEIGVGGAITYLSDPQQEYDEMLLKAIAPFSAVAQLINVDVPRPSPVLAEDVAI
ncbi:Para-aminobenzoate synthase, amidotransferase component [Acidisarcina polymorpha]|uniref:Para-aminobenzoate synthase, amidotransferase component n=1 Tax=Acidisarcina polymorpha TaxID=2211140 RepID=A0A2Z5FWC9_9BACT|nr:anthranilate synthase component I family protein [Acidisarcina polymorpha]AXC11168.1 Para-aminobenzoate synthase, amidotransferase component [Acidisarcina polymorpha]